MLKGIVRQSCGVLLGTFLLSGLAFAENGQADCKDLPSQAALKSALSNALNTPGNGGFNLNMWGTIVNRDGEVCAVAFTGNGRDEQWPGSRVISAQKANTANAFSLPKTSAPRSFTSGLALSTANLFTATQPGGSLFGLQESNPVDTSVAYGGSEANFGQQNDPMVGHKIGGVNVFGGGLALYGKDADGNRVLLGAIGVSGDTSCADHNIAWKTRSVLQLDYVPAGVAAGFAGDPTHPDNIIYDIVSQVGQMPGLSHSGFGHPTCFNTADPIALPAVRTIP
jgi:uncharacterized protein GlcG (DUF336 family)